MSGYSKRDSSQCNLRDYYESRFSSLDEQMKLRVTAASVALELANRITERRLDDLNHIREQQRDANTQFVQRETYDAQYNFLNSRIETVRNREEDLEKFAANLQGKMWMLTACLGAAFMVLQVLLKVLWK